MEFVDDYERPVLEKYEKITPTPLAKKPKEDDLDKVITLYTLQTHTNIRQFIEFYFDERINKEIIANDVIRCLD